MTDKASRLDRHPLDLLPDLVAGRLPEAAAAQVRRHLDACPTCAAELAEWRAVSGATRSRVAVPAPDLAARVAARVALERRRGRPGIGARGRWLVSFVLGQVPIVRREIWSASALVLVLGAAISLVPPAGSAPGAALGLFAPLAAALGIVLVYGPENDPSLELALATPTSPRLVVLARLTLVMAWDLVLALAASAIVVVAQGRPDGLGALVSLWLGPMLLLGCLSLVLSLVIGTSPALGIAGFLWIVRAAELADLANPNRLGGTLGPSLASVVDSLWQTSPLTLALAAAAVGIAILIAPSRSGLEPVSAE